MNHLKNFCILALVLLPGLAGASGKEPCGETGSVAERIKACAQGNPQAHPGFVLVSRAQDGMEVHKDLKTNLLWSDSFPENSVSQSDAKKACKSKIPQVATLTDLKWKLASQDEYETAHENGIVEALPNMNNFFWSSKVTWLGGLHGWVYYAYQERYYGFVGTWNFKSNKQSAKCVARE